MICGVSVSEQCHHIVHFCWRATISIILHLFVSSAATEMIIHAQNSSQVSRGFLGRQYHNVKLCILFNIQLTQRQSLPACSSSYCQTMPTCKVDSVGKCSLNSVHYPVFQEQCTCACIIDLFPTCPHAYLNPCVGGCQNV